MNGIAVVVMLVGIVAGVIIAHHDGYLIGKEHGYTEGNKKK
jgi:uncharacterized protein HemY